MIEWLQDYYTDTFIRHPENVRRKISRGKPPAGVYLITLSNTPGNLMEIMPAGLLRQKAFMFRCPKIIGMALGKGSAVQLARRILEEVYEQTGDFGLSDYLMQTRG